MNAAAPDLFITTDAVGGVWSYSIALARGAATSGARCVLAVLGPATRPEQRAAIGDIAGCSLIETGLPLDWMVTQRAELDEIVHALIGMARETGCRAAHLHAPALAAQPWPIPVIAVAHSCMASWWDAVHGTALPDSMDWHRSATGDGLAEADAIIAPSHAFAAALRRVYPPARDICVIHNGLADAASHDTGQDVARETAVLAAGRLWDAGKNMAVLDYAALMLDMPVTLAGPDRAPDGAPAQFAHVRRAGNLPQDALHKLMAHHAIFAAPSVYEPFGLAVLEAAQQASALILSDIPTFRELWSDAAVFVPSRAPADWAAAIRALAGEPDRMARLGRAAATRSRRYTQHAMVSATLAVHGSSGRARRAA